MKRRRSSSPSSSEKMVYAVFQTIIDQRNRYLIYRLDKLAWKDDEYYKFGRPIFAMKAQEYPSNMFVFSLGSKIYFCGGNEFMDISGSGTDWWPIYTSKAYMLDLKSDQQGTVPINPMNFPKPNPLVFGPVDGHKFYVFSNHKHRRGDYDASFEMLDTNTNEWTSLPLPPTEKGRKNGLGHSSALIGTNILISSASPPKLYAFCTRTAIWHVVKVGRRIVDPHEYLPFHTAYPLCPGNRSSHLLLGLHGMNSLPELYWYRKLHRVNRAGPFRPSAIPKGLKDQWENIAAFLGDTDIKTNIYYFDDEDKVCVVRSDEPESMRFTVDVFDAFLVGNEMNVKMEKALQYKYLSTKMMVPKHVLFA